MLKICMFVRAAYRRAAYRRDACTRTRTHTHTHTQMHPETHTHIHNVYERVSGFVSLDMSEVVRALMYVHPCAFMRPSMSACSYLQPVSRSAWAKQGA